MRKILKSLTVVFVLCMAITFMSVVALATDKGNGTGIGVENAWDISANDDTSEVYAYLEQNNSDNDNPKYTLVFSGKGASKDHSKSGLTPDYTATRPWHQYSNSITKVVIQDGVTYLGQRSCLNLAVTDIVWPKTDLTIGFSSFNGCTSLKTLHLPSNITIGVENNASWTFYGCSALETVKTASDIRTQQFGGCTVLHTVEVLPGVTNIDYYAFQGCIALTNLSLPDGLLSFGAFGNIALDLTDLVIELPDTVESLGSYTFQNVTLGGIFIPGSVTDFKPGSLDTANENCVIYLESSAAYELIQAGYSGGSPVYRNQIVAFTNGGTFASGNIHVAGTLSVPQKEGYTFGGWYKDEELTTPVSVVESNKIYYAKWVSRVTYDSNSGINAPAYADIPEEKSFNEASTKLAEPTRTGYDFGGWFVTPDYSGGALTGTYTPAGNVTLTAKWTKEIDGTTYCVLPKITDQTYDGDEIKTDATVYANEAIITEGYTIEYKNNINVGTAVVAVKVDGIEIGTASFTIGKAIPTLSFVNTTLSKYTMSTAFANTLIKPRYVTGVTYACSDKSVATVDETTGLVTIVGSGTATVTATAVETANHNKATASYELTVIVYSDDYTPTPTSDTEPNEPDLIENPFTDITDSAWYYEDVLYCFDKGLIKGTTDEEFSPNIATSRGMVVMILWRLEGELKEAAGNSLFDAADGKYYTDALAWAAENGIVFGYGEGKFGADDKITREQLAVILYRYAAFRDIDISHQDDLSDFSDGDKVSDYAMTSMKWAVSQGLIMGNKDNTLNPTGDTQRCESATMLRRFCENIII